MIKNRYEIQGDIMVMYLDRRGNATPIPTVVSATRLEELEAFPYKWVAAWRKSTNSFYVMSRQPDSNGKFKTVYLHRFLNKPAKNQEVDHKDHDTLNNTDDNMQNLPKKQHYDTHRYGRDYTA